MCAKRAEVHAIYNLLSVSSVWRGNCVGLSSLHGRAVGGAGCAGCAGCAAELVGWWAGGLVGPVVLIVVVVVAVVVVVVVELEQVELEQVVLEQVVVLS